MPKSHPKQIPHASSHNTQKEKRGETASEITSQKKPVEVSRLSAPISRISGIPRKYVAAAVLGIALSVIAGYFFSRWMVVATVNGRTITRAEYTWELEKMSGKQVLEDLITRNIILQEAKSRNISVSSEDVDAEIKNLEEQLKTQGQSLDQILALQGGTREIIREQITFSKTLEKMVGNDVPVSTQAVDTYIEENPALAADENADLDQLRKLATEQLKRQKVDQKIQKLVQDLRQKANIQYFNE